MKTSKLLRRATLAGAFLLLSVATSHAAVIADWSLTLSNPGNTWTNPHNTTSGPRQWTPGLTAGNLVISSLDKGAGVADSSDNTGFGGTVGRHATLDAAIIAEAWITFNIAPETGYDLTINSISAGVTNHARTTGSTATRNNSPHFFQWQVSIDAGAFVNFGDVISPAGTNTVATAYEVIPDSDLFIADGSEAVFRLVAYGDNGQNTNLGKWTLGSHLVGAVVVNGDVATAAVPEPAAYAVIFSGLCFAAVVCRRRPRA